MYADGFTSIGTSWVFLCVNAALAGTSHSNATITVRLLGQESIYDVPDANLNKNYLFNPEDPLFPYLPPSYFTQFANTSWPLTGAYYYDVLGLPGPITWPNRQRLDPTLTTTFPFSATYNYTVASNFRYVYQIRTLHFYVLFFVCCGFPQKHKYNDCINVLYFQLKMVDQLDTNKYHSCMVLVNRRTNS